MNVDPALLALLPRDCAVAMQVMPLRIEDGHVVVATGYGMNPDRIADLSFVLGRAVEVEEWDDTEIAEAIAEHYGGDSPRPSIALQAPAGEELAAGSMVAGGSVVELVNSVISDAVRMHASDVHIEPYEREMRIRYRLDGVLREIARPPLEQARAIISRLKIMADLDIAERRRPQDGRIRVKEADRTIDVRVSSLPTDFGEKIVLRILDKSQLQLDLARLGFEDSDRQAFERALHLPYGMILVTGPTGSGKTTTLYAALNALNRPDVNITTIEDPIEYNLPGINQTHVRSEIGLTFAASLRSILRQDPNIIMVGEIRDGETAEIATRAALTGHLVLSTLHTNDALSAVTRLIDMGVEPFLVAASLKMVVAQRLLRRVCPDCAEPIAVEPDHILEDGLKPRASYRQAKGCAKCDYSGHHGRTAAYSILSVSKGLAARIGAGACLDELQALASAEAHRSLRQAALAKVSVGETSLEEVLKET